MEETEAKDLVPLHEMIKIAREKTGNTYTSDRFIAINMALEYKARFRKDPIRVYLDQPMSDLYDDSLQQFLEDYLEKMQGVYRDRTQ